MSAPTSAASAAAAAYAADHAGAYDAGEETDYDAEMQANEQAEQQETVTEADVEHAVQQLEQQFDHVHELISTLPAIVQPPALHRLMPEATTKSGLIGKLHSRNVKLAALQAEVRKMQTQIPKLRFKRQDVLAAEWEYRTYRTLEHNREAEKHAELAEFKASRKRIADEAFQAAATKATRKHQKRMAVLNGAAAAAPAAAAGAVPDLR